MIQIHRIIPVLLLKGTELVKTKRFGSPRYVGDILNAMSIFNEKSVDEILVVDIEATRRGQGPNIPLITDLASECFMPMCYGGGIASLAQAQDVLSTGVEKVALNAAFWTDPDLVTRIAEAAGSQSVVVSIDAVAGPDGQMMVRNNATARPEDIRPWQAAVRAAELGAGEIFLQSVDRDGLRTGYDLELIRQVSDSVDVPVIAGSGADTVRDLASAIVLGGAQAAAAGAMFVFYGALQSVLITMPDGLALSEAIHDLRKQQEGRAHAGA